MLFAKIMPNAAKSMALFALAAFFLVWAAGGPFDRMLARLIIELPLLLLVAALGTLLIDLIASIGGTILGGVGMIAAALAFVLGWAVSGGGSMSFGGLGYHSLLQPAYAIAVAAPWLLSATKQRG